MLQIIAGAIFQGVGNAFVGLTVAPSALFLFLGCAFLLASLTGTVLRAINTTSKTPVPLRETVALNIATAVTFGAFYLALIWVPALLAAGAEAAAAPLTALVLAGITHRRPRLYLWMIAMAVFLLSLAFGWSQQAAGASAPGYGTAIGLALGLTAGAGLAVLATISRHLADKGISAYSILAVRYHATYLLAFACAAVNWQEYTSVERLGSLLLWLFPLGFVAVAFPLVLIQSGMMRIPATITSMIMASVPGISFITESILVPETSSLLSWILLFALVLAVCFYGRVERRLGTFRTTTEPPPPNPGTMA